MNKSHKYRVLGTILCLFLGSLFICARALGSPEEKMYYAIETNGQVAGYIELSVLNIKENGRPLIQLKEIVENRSSALGVPFDTRGWSEYRIDPGTERFSFFEQDIDQGSLKLHISASVEGNTARINLQPGGAEKAVPLPEGVLLENPYYFPHLLKNSGHDNLGSRLYQVLDVLDRNIHKVTVTRRGTEPIQLAGKTYRAFILESLDHDIGLKSRQWINAENGYLLKAEGPRSTLSLADQSIKNKLRRVDINNHLLAKAGATISDIQAISHLKIQAKLEPIGNWITPESLSVPGQTFEGMVKDNQIDGIFEVRHARYDGRNAPPFPPNFSGDPELRSFLAPEDFIESDDDVLIQKAKDLTAGAKDSWEAAKRLSQWVAEEIGYDIPGGASARNTHDIREGECGAHSRLFAAFCRGVGIPARVVWGCMYVPNLSGSFGQHAWNEVYMGQIGWIPLDTTAREIDFADSGHIRLGILSSAHIALNPKKMEILDFQAGSQRFGEVKEAGDVDKYQPYLGRYRGPRGVFTVLVQNSSLALDIPGKMVFDLRDPDEEGLWFFKLTRDVSVSFQKDASGGMAVLTLINRVRLPKKGDIQDIKSDVPEKFRPYLGQYLIPMQKQEITVSYEGGHLAVHIPGAGIRKLEGPDGEGLWTAKPGEDRFSFIMDDADRVRTMILIETVRCARID